MASAPKPKLFAAGDAVVKTGFSRVTRSILEHLVDDYDVYQLGVNYRGQKHFLPWSVMPTTGTDLIGEHQIAELVETLRPDLIWLVGDLWMQARWLSALQNLGNRPPVCLYMPVDSAPLIPKYVAEIAGAEVVSVFTEYAKSELTGAFDLQGIASGAQIEIIPHGIKPDVFFPLDGFSRDPLDASCLIARENLFGTDTDLEGAFIVLNANRNILRKRIDITVRGFAEFAADKPKNVFLHLHMGSPDDGWNLEDLAQRFGIKDRLILTSRATSIPSVDETQMNQIYNAASVGVNTAFAEAWGLVNLEHAATGAPQIVAGHSGLKEIWADSALLLDPVLTLTSRDSWTDEYMVDASALAAALERLYGDPDLYGHYAQAAYDTAQQPQYRWSSIAQRWDDIFQRLLAR